MKKSNLPGAQPAATTNRTPNYGSGSPGNVVQPPPPQPLVVNQPPPSPPPPPQKPKESKLPMICCCMFIIIIIICMSTITWPGETTKELFPGSQTLVTLNGAFIQAVRVTADSSTNTYIFYDKPGLGPFRHFAKALAFPQAPLEFSRLMFNLLEGSSVSVSWEYSGCTLRFLVLYGERKYSSYVEGGNPKPYYSLNFNRPETLTINLKHTNQFYFVFEITDTSCYPPPTTATFDISAKSYNTSNAFLHCKGNCWVSTSLKMYMVLETPAVNLQVGETYNFLYSINGKPEKYIALYVGLFIGMVLFYGAAVCIVERKVEKVDVEDSQRLLAPEPPQTIHPVSPDPHQNAPAQPAAPQYPIYYSRFFGAPSSSH